MLTPEQLELRKGTLGSSEIGAVAGLSRFAGPLDVWLSKPPQCDSVPPRPVSVRMRIGSATEPVLLQLAEEHIGRGPVTQCTETAIHPYHDWVSATPDGILTRPSDELEVLECKDVGHWMVDQWEHGPPAVTTAQIQWQMEVTGIRTGYIVAALSGQPDLRVYPVEYDLDFVGGLLDIGETFWRRHVLTGVPPDVDGSASARRFLERRHPKHVAPLKPTDALAEGLAAELKAARIAHKRAENEWNEIRNKFCEWLAGSEGSETSEGKITWKAPKAKSKCDYEAVAMALGQEIGPERFAEVCKQHTRTTAPSRRFNVPRAWTKEL